MEAGHASHAMPYIPLSIPSLVPPCNAVYDMKFWLFAFVSTLVRLLYDHSCVDGKSSQGLEVLIFVVLLLILPVSLAVALPNLNTQIMPDKAREKHYAPQCR